MCALRATRHTFATHASKCWCVCGKNFNIVSMCVVSPVVHTSNISSCQKKKLFQFFCDCEEFHWGRSFGFLVINVCNHGEHYETPCIIVRRAPHSVALLLKPLKHRLIMSLRSGIQNCFIVDPYLFKPTNFDSVYAIHLDRRIYETKFTSHLNVLFPFPISRTAVTFPSTLTTFVLFAVAVLSRDQSAVNCATGT